MISFSLILSRRDFQMIDFQMIMLYEFKLNHSAAEAARNLALAFGSESPSEKTVRCFFAKFAFGDFDLEEKPIAVEGCR
ncbi:hypothetical protein Y032_0133g1791 [Ancylostoma ceylanicum]|uniref:Mos1 transposase HTH domain-containing protein n=1 Tax=Ancylostoma ceylanicum TaxID=53326 RepID=A0A016T684_9BILA|nr:hypothetical protein Y032_0133g1791 [Ancylostoma ceylanicum]